MKPPFRYRRIRMVVTALIFSVMCLSILFGSDFASGLFHLQFAPALSRLAFTFSITALLIVLATVTTSIVFGRIYCAAFCPLGVAQDLVDAFVPRKAPISIPNPKKLRYLVALIVFAFLFGGCAVGLRLLDPYSVFSAALGGGGELIAMYGTGTSANADDLRVAMWVLPIAILIIMVIWKRRLFCVTLCPVGTVIGIVSKYAIYRMKFAHTCVGCGRCVSACPVGCINVKGRHIDNERCVRCMNCISVCPKTAILFSRQQRDNVPEPETQFDPGRRNFLVRGIAATFSVVAVGCGARIILPPRTPALDTQTRLMLPPGAVNVTEFSRRCTHCLLCVAACPAKIIKLATSRYGHIYVDLKEGQCQYDCVSCSRVCPTGAIQPLTLSQKQRLRIGVASYNPRNCRVLHQEIECGLCTKACPTKAASLRFTVTGLAFPQLDDRKCIGCGACQIACPVTPKAMMIQAVAHQESNR